jgi:maltose O-acetyltransferase
MNKKVFLCIYYGFAKHLPKNETLFIGTLFKSLRRVVCCQIFNHAGKNINVNSGAYFGNGLKIKIGNDSSIGQNCQIANDVTIGCDVMMAPEVIIFSVGHQTSDISIPMRLQGNAPARPVIIEDDVWIGQRATILPGVTIGSGSIVGSGAVVTKDVAPFSVVGGNPARVIKSRKNAPSRS